MLELYVVAALICLVAGYRSEKQRIARSKMFREDPSSVLASSPVADPGSGRHS
jgi:hypothetical protein